MKLRDLVQHIRADVLYGEELLDSIDIEYAYGADLMSDVLAFARPGSSSHRTDQYPDYQDSPDARYSCSSVRKGEEAPGSRGQAGFPD